MDTSFVPDYAYWYKNKTGWSTENPLLFKMVPEQAFWSKLLSESLIMLIIEKGAGGPFFWGNK
jgi:hypothetical protein